MIEYKILDWDSNFFGFKVACLTSKEITNEKLKLTLNHLRQNNVRLLYWPAEKAMPLSSSFYIKKMGGNLVCQRVTFVIDVTDIEPADLTIYKAVKPYDPAVHSINIEAFARQCGEYSRFSFDPNISKKKVAELYAIWIKRSIQKEIADEFLLAIEGDKTIGMIALSGEKNGIGKITLICVDKNYSGKKYGEILVRAAQDWFAKKKCNSVHVVTQTQNLKACSLYNKCEFKIDNIVYYYHFWL